MKEMKTWKVWVNFFGYFIIFILGASIAAIPRFIIGFDNESGLLVSISEIIRIPTTVLLLYWYTKYVVKLPLNIPTLSAKHVNIGLWLLVGLSLPIMTVAIFYITGNLSVRSIDTELSQSYIIDVILKAFGVSLAAGFVEEIIFRGYLFNLLKSKYNFWISAFATSLLFTLTHIGGAGSLLNVVQLLIAGLLFSFMSLMIYVYTKSIWNAGIVHFLWNLLLLNGLIAFSIKGKSEVLVQLNIGDNPLFNGGDFGIETSFPAIIVYGLTSLILWQLYKKKQQTANSGYCVTGW
ncbi:MAG: type II CAAX endopeptidase family protein [Sediminibacterium sp.]|nr:type II CAAX endopeptidase family protein [Sediminibacterium sp.]MDP1811047.1 type II CAAX endopeptidase family protein [Sediminibacterium sp.]MDP3128243.1 type II CAAX endopeptidase family protein [Sediminibacterium sp.]